MFCSLPFIAAVMTGMVCPADAQSIPAPAGFFNIRDYGAKGDSVTIDTPAIQAAVDDCAKTGGTVFFPPGRYLSGTIMMRSGVILRLSGGAVLLGSPGLADYPEKVPALRSYTDNYVRRSLIYGENLDEVGICGEGTIDGNGSAPSFQVNEYLPRPYIIRFISCRGVRIQDITLCNSPMWMQHYLACDDMIISGIKVYNHGNRNNDMIDLDGCRNVVMSDCIGDTDDDGITIKSTLPRPSEHITISNCVVSSHCNAIKMGTESTGGFRNIAISNCVVKPSAHRGVVYGAKDGISGIALEIVDGGVMENITVSNVSIDRVGTPIFIRLGNRGRKYTESAPQPEVGVMRNIRISGIVARGVNASSSITGIPGHPVENISLHDIRIISAGGGGSEELRKPVPENEGKYPEATMFGTRLPAYGLYIRHGKGIELDHVTCVLDNPDYRPALVCEDIDSFDADAFRADPPKAGPLLRLAGVRDAFIRNSRALAGTDAFIRVEGTDTRRIILKGNDTHGSARTVEYGAGVPQKEITRDD
jgi:hypothetical protein